ncbi:MAG: hypothetical protein AAFY84_04950 [Pseudomonadota bacterium]
MRTFSVALIGASLLASAAFAQSSTINKSLEDSTRASIEDAIAALNTGDFRTAHVHLATATDSANRLELRRVAAEIAGDVGTFKADVPKFALAGSSTLTFEQFLKSRETTEQIFRDPNGNIVTVRVFGEDQDLKDFMFIKDDTKMLDKAKLEVVEMRGEPAIKRRGEDGSLSVLMMSDEDHALIEIDGESEAAVMALIEQLEAANSEDGGQ